MEKEVIKSIIVGKQRDIPVIRLQRREMSFGDETNYVIVGLRRAGKSYMLYQDIQQRISEGKNSAEDILYINFEDERLTGTVAAELNTLIDAYQELFGPERRPMVYLDEIQNVTGWEKFARRLADEGYRVMITGSNAKLLSSEIASTLGGRYIPREVSPFSFKEYLEYKGIYLDSNWDYDSKARANVVRSFNEYFQFGGIAESFRQPDRREYLNALYQKILVGDIVERNLIRNPRVFRLLARKLADSVMQPTSLSRLRHIVKSTGETISLSVLKDYLDYMSDAYLTFEVPNLSSPMTERETLKKRYFSDNGILNLFLHKGETKLLENIVAISLHNRLRSLDGEPRLFYYSRSTEVDFCVPELRQAIQVAYSIADPATFERETAALVKFLKMSPGYSGIIVTLDDQRTIRRDGFEISVVPVYKMLM